MATAKQPTEKATKPAKSPVVGVLLPDALYTLEALSAHCGLGRWGLREARAAGLKVLRFHGRGWVRGADFIAFLEQQNAHAKRPKQSKSAVGDDTPAEYAGKSRVNET